MGVGLFIVNAVKDLILINQFLRKNGLEPQSLHLVGWLLCGVGWHRFQDTIPFKYDDPPFDCTF